VRIFVGVVQVSVPQGKFDLSRDCSSSFSFLRVPPTVSFYARDTCLLRRIVDGHIDHIPPVHGSFVGDHGEAEGPVDAAGNRCDDERASLRPSQPP
jgi:hypothetical protein